MGLKINVFEEDPSLLKLITFIFEKKGHKVCGYTDCSKYPACPNGDCDCRGGEACADAVIINAKQPIAETLQKLMAFDRFGCQLSKVQKAIMCTYFTEEQTRAIEASGYVAIKKPFTISKIVDWLNQPSPEAD